MSILEDHEADQQDTRGLFTCREDSAMCALLRKSPVHYIKVCNDRLSLWSDNKFSDYIESCGVVYVCHSIYDLQV